VFSVAATTSLSTHAQSVKQLLGANVAGNADYIPSWPEPEVFRWNNYWVEVEGNHLARDKYKGGYTQVIALTIKYSPFFCEVFIAEGFFVGYIRSESPPFQH
jgi:hypothetical protein